MTTLTPEAKQLLSTTIRSLRERLLRDLLGEANGRYRLSLPLAKAGLDEAHRKRRERLEAWIEQQLRTLEPAKKDEKAIRERLLHQAVKQAAATLLNRVIALRHLEALGLSRPAVVIGGWNSKGFREFREFAVGLTGDETQGYATLLGFVFDELAVDLPGLFGDVGLTALFPVPPATMREVIEKLDEPELASAWTDDTTLGWVYQYWNDPERREVDARLDAQTKLDRGDLARLALLAPLGSSLIEAGEHALGIWRPPLPPAHRKPRVPEAVLKQPLNHVSLGEHLRLGGEVAAIELGLGVEASVDFASFRVVPVLVDPPKRGVVRPRGGELGLVELLKVLVDPSFEALTSLAMRLVEPGLGERQREPIATVRFAEQITQQTLAKRPDGRREELLGFGGERGHGFFRSSSKHLA